MGANFLIKMNSKPQSPRSPGTPRKKRAKATLLEREALKSNPYKAHKRLEEAVVFVPVVDLPLLDTTLVPKSLKSKLRPHQAQGVQWILDRESRRLPRKPDEPPADFWEVVAEGTDGQLKYRNILTQEVLPVNKTPNICQGGMLVDGCGLGKTLTILTAIRVDLDATPSTKRRPILVVMPTSVTDVWPSQMKLHFDGDAFNVNYFTSASVGDPDIDLRHVDVVFTTYNVLALAWTAHSKANDAARESLFTTKFKRVVYDEGQELVGSNLDSKTRQAARAIQADHRWIVSATPLNIIEDMGVYLQVLQAFEPLSQPDTFKAHVADKIANGSDGAMKIFEQIFSSIALRRTPDILAKNSVQLANIKTQIIEVELDAPSRALYDAVEKLADASSNVLKWGQHLVQAVLHGGVLPDNVIRDVNAVLTSDEVARMAGFKRSSRKLREIVDILRRKPANEQAVVYVHSQVFLGFVEKELNDQGYKTFRFEKKTADTRAFAKYPGAVALITPMTGGAGIDLSAANHFIVPELWWHRGKEDQAVGRCHRPGQTKPVTVYKICAKDTIDQRMLTAQESKHRVISNILTSTMYVPRVLTK